MAHTSTYQITSTTQEKKYIAKSSSATGTNLLLGLMKLERLHKPVCVEDLVELCRSLPLDGHTD